MGRKHLLKHQPRHQEQLATFDSFSLLGWRKKFWRIQENQTQHTVSGNFGLLDARGIVTTPHQENLNIWQHDKIMMCKESQLQTSHRKNADQTSHVIFTCKGNLHQASQGQMQEENNTLTSVSMQTVWHQCSTKQKTHFICNAACQQVKVVLNFLQSGKNQTFKKTWCPGKTMWTTFRHSDVHNQTKTSNESGNWIGPMGENTKIISNQKLYFRILDIGFHRDNTQNPNKLWEKFPKTVPKFFCVSENAVKTLIFPQIQVSPSIVIPVRHNSVWTQWAFFYTLTAFDAPETTLEMCWIENISQNSFALDTSNKRLDWFFSAVWQKPSFDTFHTQTCWVHWKETQNIMLTIEDRLL